jgi:Dynamin family
VDAWIAEIDALAAALNPGSGQIASHVGKLADADDARLVADGLRRTAQHVKPDTVQVGFGGHFSSGKSSLINLLIGTPLLPTSDYPETGVACLLRSGDANRVLVRTDADVTEVPFSTEAIASYVSLIGDDGDYRQEVRAVQDLRIILANRPIPAGATWVDSPGINDASARTMEVPAKVARDSHVLVWVVNSRQPLALTEQAFLAEHMTQAGPTSVVFLVNVFLENDTTEAWEAFITSRAYRHETRITESIDTGNVPPCVVFASARAAALQRDGFGGPQACALVASISDPAAPRIVATRLFRAERELCRLLAELHARMAAEQQRVTTASAMAAEHEKRRKRRHEEFLRAVRKEIADVFAAASDVAENCARSVQPAASGSLQSASSYGEALTQRLRDTMAELADDLASAIDRCALRHGHSTLGNRGRSDIVNLLEPDNVVISGPGSGGDIAAGATAGAVIGGIIGSLFFGIGAAPGAAIGSALGAGAGGSSATSKQRAAIRSQLAQAGAAATAQMLSRKDAITARAERYCALDAPAAAPVDDTRLNALRDVRRQLETDALGPVTTALAAWQAKAGG